MSVNFFDSKCQTFSDKKLFGLCDDPPPYTKPAYIDEVDGAKWIAVVNNEYKYYITFTAIDNCIKIEREDKKPAKRCDGVLTYNATIVFVELKERGAIGNEWVKEAEKQLRITIGYFEKSPDAENYRIKKAYIANSEHPKFKETQFERMEKFFVETGYVLRIENRINVQ